MTIASLILAFYHIKQQRTKVSAQKTIIESGVVDYNRRSSTVSIGKFHEDELPTLFSFTGIFLRTLLGYILLLSATATQEDGSPDVLCVMDSIAFISCCVDPMIYLATQEKFRHAFMEVLCCVKAEVCYIFFVWL